MRNPVRDFTPVGNLSESTGRNFEAFDGSKSDVKMQEYTLEAGFLKASLRERERDQYRLVHLQKGQFFMT